MMACQSHRGFVLTAPSGAFSSFSPFFLPLSPFLLAVSFVSSPCHSFCRRFALFLLLKTYPFSVLNSSCCCPVISGQEGACFYKLPHHLPLPAANQRAVMWIPIQTQWAKTSSARVSCCWLIEVTCSYETSLNDTPTKWKMVFTFTLCGL